MCRSFLRRVLAHWANKEYRIVSTCVFDVFAQCSGAVLNGEQIERASQKDKEFHFQNWFDARLRATTLQYDSPARNTYPDFRLVKFTEGFEIKGLEYPGRIADFDCNSQIPAGLHNGRSIYYVFGRYPKSTETRYPVLDLVVCHGDLLNARHDYIHKNKSFRGFGSYGDILVRDRKMYVAPTPFGLLDGLDRQVTLIVPYGVTPDLRFQSVGYFERVEAATSVVGYSFDLKTNTLSTTEEANPGAARVHKFSAFRLQGAPTTEVKMKAKPSVPTEADAASDD